MRRPASSPPEGGTESRARLGVLIPAYQPDQRLADLAGKLMEAGFSVVVVDDGSSAASAPVFQALDPAVVLRHEENRGKGRALKTGLAYLADRGFTGAVTRTRNPPWRLSLTGRRPWRAGAGGWFWEPGRSRRCRSGPERGTA